VSFALKLHATGGTSDVSGLKKGVTVVVKGAERSGVVDGKQGFVGALVEELQVYCFLVCEGAVLCFVLIHSKFDGITLGYVEQLT